MSIWGDNPEWFDEWIIQRALDGNFGEDVQKKVEVEELTADDLWKDHLDLGSDAELAYCERLVF